MAYGIEVYNSEGTKIVSPNSSLGTIIAHGKVSADQARYDTTLYESLCRDFVPSGEKLQHAN